MTFTDTELDEFEAKQRAIERRRISKSLAEDAERSERMWREENREPSLSDPRFSIKSVRSAREEISSRWSPCREDMICGYRTRELLWVIEKLLSGERP